MACSGASSGISSDRGMQRVRGRRQQLGCSLQGPVQAGAAAVRLLRQLIGVTLSDRPGTAWKLQYSTIMSQAA